MVSLTYAARVSCYQRNFAAELDRDCNGHCDRHGRLMTGTPPGPMPPSEETMQDVQRLIALKPPTDPVTGLMQYDTRQAAQYRHALQDIVDRYGSVESFQDAMRDSGMTPEHQLAKAAPPAAPNVMAAPSAEASLAQFAQDMMAPGRPPATVGNAGPPALLPRRDSGTVL